MKKSRIAVIGSLNMDIVVSMERMPVPGETVAGREIHTIPGGKGANQAVGCAKLGAEVTLIGAVGGDEFGAKILQQMQAYGVRTDSIVQLPEASTGMAMIYHTVKDNSIVVVPGANGLCRSDMIELHATKIRAAEVLLVQLEVPLDTVHHALCIARKAGVTTVLNPAPAQTLPSEILRLADFVTPNETEFALIGGASCIDEKHLVQAMDEWQREHSPRLLVTRGALGVSLLHDSGLLTISAPKVEVIDTTGAGDAFNAAFSCALAAGQTPEQAADFAVRAASLSVTKFGAQEGMPTLQEVLQIAVKN